MYKMNEIVNKFLLAGDKLMLELHIALVDYLQKNKERILNLKKQEIHNIFCKTNQTKLVFNMTWLMEILKI